MTPEGLARLKLDEACALQAYPDPDSPLGEARRLAPDRRPAGWEALSGAPWTCGYGCTGPGIGPGVVWTRAQAEVELAARVEATEAALRRALPWFVELARRAPVRADVLVNMAFNLGVGGLLRWRETLAAVAAGDFADAARDLRANGRWRAQVHGRADRCAEALATGRW